MAYRLKAQMRIFNFVQSMFDPPPPAPYTADYDIGISDDCDFELTHQDVVFGASERYPLLVAIALAVLHATTYPLLNR